MPDVDLPVTIRAASCLLVFLAAACSIEQHRAAPEPDEQACSSDDDCVLFDASCCEDCPGWSAPYPVMNRDAVASRETWKQLACLTEQCADYYSCPNTPPENARPTLRCVSGSCTAKLESLSSR